MPQFSRTIIISSENLGGNSSPTLILTFDEQPMEGIYKEYFPVVWKLATFPTEGPYALTLTYKNQLVFISPQLQVGNNKVVAPATWVEINPGQQTELIEQPSDATKSFTTVTRNPSNLRRLPQPQRETAIKAINKTQTPQNIGVGFDDGGTPPPAMLVFTNIGATSSVTAQFTPILKAYIVSDYKENSVLWKAIKTPVIFQQNLADLEETTNWTLKRDPASGQYSIIAASRRLNFK